MSRVVSRRLFWDDVGADLADFSGYSVYVGPAADPDFVARVDSGALNPFRETTLPELVLAPDMLPEGVYQFAVCTRDTAGNFSDPFQATLWNNVPLDLTAPPSPTNGGIQVL